MVMDPLSSATNPLQGDQPAQDDRLGEAFARPTVDPSGSTQGSDPFSLERYRDNSPVKGRQIVVVLGMHRSGTSLLSSVLHLLGVDMVRDTPHASAANPTGYWERQDITALQDEVLAIIDRPIGKPSHALPFPAGWWRDLRLTEVKAKLRDLIRIQVAEVAGPWGFKDPRTCRLFPLWAEIFAELGLHPKFVWALRHPIEAAHSMTLKSPNTRPLAVDHSETMWLLYNYDIVRYVLQYNPVIVTYDQWFPDPVATAERLAGELGVPWHGTRDELAEILSDVVDREHRHHWHAERPQGREHLSHAFYNGVLALRSGGAVAQLNALLPSIRWTFDALGPFVRLADQLAPLEAKLARRTKVIETLRAEREKTKMELEELRRQALAQADRPKIV